jgi:hypothetical protein
LDGRVWRIRTKSDQVDRLINLDYTSTFLSASRPAGLFWKLTLKICESEKIAACALQTNFSLSRRQRLPDCNGFKPRTTKFIYLFEQATPMNRAERLL